MARNRRQRETVVLAAFDAASTGIVLGRRSQRMAPHSAEFDAEWDHDIGSNRLWELVQFPLSRARRQPG